MQFLKVRSADKEVDVTLNPLFVPKSLGRFRVGRQASKLLKQKDYGVYIDEKRVWVGKGVVLSPFFERLAQQFPALVPNFNFHASRYVFYVALIPQEITFRLELVSGNVTGETLVPNSHLEPLVSADVERGTPMMCALFGATKELDNVPSEVFVNERLSDTLRFRYEEFDKILDYQVQPVSKTLLKNGYPTPVVMRSAFGTTGLLILALGLNVLRGIFFGGDGDGPISLAPEGGWQPIDDEVPVAVVNDQTDQSSVMPASETEAYPLRSSHRWDMATFGELLEADVWTNFNLSFVEYRRDNQDRVRIDVSSRAPDNPDWHRIATAWGALVGEPPTVGGQRVSSPVAPHQNIVRQFTGGFDVREPANSHDISTLCALNGGDYTFNQANNLHRCTVQEMRIGRWQANVGLLGTGRLANARCEFAQNWTVITQCILEFADYERSV